jgi:hypothetical protein
MHKEHKVEPIYPLQIATLLTFLNIALASSKAQLKINGHNAATYIERRPRWRSHHSDKATGWAIRGSTSGR